MTTFTPTEARHVLCPFAQNFVRSQDGVASAGCIGPGCALWRWQPLPADLLKPHVEKIMEGNALKHKEAVAWVMDRRNELGIPTSSTHGYCGAGGKP